jgi:hypothetical protein
MIALFICDLGLLNGYRNATPSKTLLCKDIWRLTQRAPDGESLRQAGCMA